MNFEPREHTTAWYKLQSKKLREITHEVRYEFDFRYRFEYHMRERMRWQMCRHAWVGVSVKATSNSDGIVNLIRS